MIDSAAEEGVKKRVLLSWSSGKDSAWALHVLRQQPDVEVVGLLTTFNKDADRVAMHAVRRELVYAQASAAGLDLWPVFLPSPCTNAEYEELMTVALARACAERVTHVAFGDLFLEDVRDYRIRQMAGTGVAPLFPLWTSAEQTPALANRMLADGVRAVLTCVDPRQLPESFVGRQYRQRAACRSAALGRSLRRARRIPLLLLRRPDVPVRDSRDSRRRLDARRFLLRRCGRRLKPFERL